MAGGAVVTIREAAHRLHVHENTIRNWMGRKIIGFVRLPSGIRRIPEQEVHRLERSMFVIEGSLPEKSGAPPVAADRSDERPEQRPRW